MNLCILMKEYAYICNVQYVHTYVFTEYCTVYTLSELLKKSVIDFRTAVVAFV